MAFFERPARAKKNEPRRVSERRRKTPGRFEFRPRTVRLDRATHPPTDRRSVCVVSPLPAPVTTDTASFAVVLFLFAFALRTRGELGALTIRTRFDDDEHNRNHDR